MKHTTSEATLKSHGSAPNNRRRSSVSGRMPSITIRSDPTGRKTFRRAETELTLHTHSLHNITKHMNKEEERAAQDLFVAIKSKRPDDHDTSIALTTKLFFERHGSEGSPTIVKRCFSKISK